MDAVVVGGGVIGCAVARELALAGASVALLERGAPEGGASWVAAGMLSPLAEAREAGVFLDLLRAGREIYPEFVAALIAETGIDPLYRTEGTLLLSLRPEDDAELEERHAWQTAAALPVDRMTAGELRSAEPLLSTQVRWGLRYAGDHQVDNRLLGKALWAAAERAGVELRRGSKVSRLLTEAGRVTGVEVAGGERVGAKWVVVAAGAHSAGIAGLPRPLPVRPVHGQIVTLRTEMPLLRHVVDSPRGYLVPRLDGEMVVGATVEEIGFRRGPTAEGVHALIAAAIEVSPALAEAAVGELRAGHRPGTPDALPILGPDPDLDGLFYATGHYRNGILLAPLTGRLLATMIRGGVPHFDPAPFGICRFLQPG